MLCILYCDILLNPSKPNGWVGSEDGPFVFLACSMLNSSFIDQTNLTFKATGCKLKHNWCTVPGFQMICILFRWHLFIT